MDPGYLYSIKGPYVLSFFYSPFYQSSPKLNVLHAHSTEEPKTTAVLIQVLITESTVIFLNNVPPTPQQKAVIVYSKSQ